jgi:hypothetical protein
MSLRVVTRTPLVEPDQAGGAAGERLELTLRGFSPRELTARAERVCKGHFGECAWKIDEATCVPCMGSLGGRIRLYEARFVATELTTGH